MSRFVSEPHAAAPFPNHRLVASRFPPIAAFETVATAADIKAVIELAGWTDDTQVAARLARLPDNQLVYGRAGASVIMSAFLFAAPGGSRFNTEDLGAWYAAADLRTAAAEIGHHMRRETSATGIPLLTRQFISYGATLAGDYCDVRARRGHLTYRGLYFEDDYLLSQRYASLVRSDAEDGILYKSVRLKGGECVVAFKPSNVMDVVQNDRVEITVERATKHINVRHI